MQKRAVFITALFLYTRIIKYIYDSNCFLARDLTKEAPKPLKL
jgi:hypothetical protein